MKKILAVAIIAVLLLSMVVMSVKAQDQFVGSKNSDVYHYPSCSSAKQILVSNQIWFVDGVNLTTKKKQRSRVADKLEKGAVELLITPDMSNEDITKGIYENMLDLAGHEAGTGWMRLGTLLSGNSTDQMLGAGFKALIDQNKIIIRQNELILRALQQKQLPPPP